MVIFDNFNYARILVAIEISRVDEVHEWDLLMATKMSANLVKII
jgi:hypothetical protein